MRTLFTKCCIWLLTAPLMAVSLSIGVAAEEQLVGTLAIQAKIARGGDFLSYAFDSLWMVTGNRLVRVNSEDNSFIEIKVEGLTGRNRGIAEGATALWVPDIGSQTIYKVDPVQGQVKLKVKAVLEDSEGSIGVGHGAVWAVTTEGAGVTSKEYNHTLSRFNAESGNLEATIRLPAQCASVIFAEGAVWITGVNKAELYRVDPVSNQVVATISTHKRPRFMTSGAGAIWVVSQAEGIIDRIDPVTNTIVASIPAGAEGGGGDISYGEGYVWVVTAERLIIKVDASTNGVVGRFRAPREEYTMGDAIRYGNGSLWVSGNNIFRIALP